MAENVSGLEAPLTSGKELSKMATAAVVFPSPRSPEGDVPMKTEIPSIRPPSPSAPPRMFTPQISVMPGYERRDSGESEKNEHGRSQSTPMTGPASPLPKRTNSTGTLPPFLASSAIHSPPSFNPSSRRDTSPESRQTRSSENIPTGGSSPESSPQQRHDNIGRTPYHNGQHMGIRSSEHQLYSSQDYDAMMRPKKRHKTSRACDECRRKKVLYCFSSKLSLDTL